MKLTQSSLDNLKKGVATQFTKENALSALSKSLATRQANAEAKAKFKKNAKMYMELKDTLPNLTATDVIRIAMHTALQDKNFEDAARYANMLAEYEQPKLQRVEKNVTSKIVDLTDEELQRMMEEEGLQ